MRGNFKLSTGEGAALPGGGGCHAPGYPIADGPAGPTPQLLELHLLIIMCTRDLSGKENIISLLLTEAYIQCSMPAAEIH